MILLEIIRKLTYFLKLCSSSTRLFFNRCNYFKYSSIKRANRWCFKKKHKHQTLREYSCLNKRDVFFKLKLAISHRSALQVGKFNERFYNDEQTRSSHLYKKTQLIYHNFWIIDWFLDQLMRERSCLSLISLNSYSRAMNSHILILANE